MAEAHANRSQRRMVAIGLEYPIDLQGGVSVLCKALIEELSNRYGVILVSPDSPETLAGSGLEPRLQGHIFWDPGAPSRSSASALAEQLHAAGTDIAHFHFGGNYGWGTRVYGASPITFAAKRGIKVFTTVHLILHLLDGYCGPEKPLPLKLGLLPFAWAGKMNVLANVQREIAVSQHDARLLRRWYAPSRHQFTQIYHSRLSGLDPVPAFEREKIILNVGHLAFRKGQPDLVKAFARISAVHPDWKLVLIGHAADPAAETRIRDLIATHQLADRVLLPGAVPNPRSWMLRAGIYVQPSWWEALGLALQEAMFVGAPCIGAAVGGIPELIQPRTGRLFPARDIDQLAQAMDELIRSPVERHQLGEAAAKSIRERGMTRDAMARAHITLYEQALGNNTVS